MGDKHAQDAPICRQALDSTSTPRSRYKRTVRSQVSVSLLLQAVNLSSERTYINVTLRPVLTVPSLSQRL